MTNFNIQSLAQLDRSRFAGYKANLDFYNGEQWADISLRSGTKNRQLVFNYAKIAIDKLTSYLTEGLNFACEPCGLFRRKSKLIFWTCLPAAASSSTLIISI
jgi:hypothetical protein